MDALVMNVQPQMTAELSGQATQPAARANGAANKGAFVRVLQQAAGADAGERTAVSMTGEPALMTAVPLNLLAVLCAGQSGSEELSAVAEQLLALLKADDTLADRLLEDPLFAEWLAEAMTVLMPVQTGATESVPLPDAARESSEGLIPMILIRLADRLSMDKPETAAQTVAEKLTVVLDALAEKYPALRAIEGNAAPKASAPAVAMELAEDAARAKQAESVPATKPAPADENVRPTFRMVKTDGMREDANRSLLDRLAFMNPTVAIKAVPATGETETDAPAAKPMEKPSSVKPAAVMPAEETQYPHPLAATVANPLMDRASFVPVRQTAMQTIVVNARQFAEEMADFVVKQFTITRTGLVSEAKITLVPEHLGQLDVKISVQNGTVSAMFSAENASAKEMLQLQLPALRAALEQQGFQVDRLIVSQQQTGGPATGHFQDDRGRHAGNQERRQSGSRDAAMEAESFEILLDPDASYGEEALLRYGSTFHATA